LFRRFQNEIFDRTTFFQVNKTRHSDEHGDHDVTRAVFDIVCLRAVSGNCDCRESSAKMYLRLGSLMSPSTSRVLLAGVVHPATSSMLMAAVSDACPCR
jgi:hypothetical protein